jgi:nicotinic acid phosphoribosyltransferase
MRDMRRGVPSYLLDTYHTIDSGLPMARRVMQERPHACAVRYDSGNKVIQYLIACEMFREAGLAPMHVIEDGLDLEITCRFEELRKFTGIPPEQQVYGYGGYIVAQPGGYRHTRDRVSGVYKLSETSGEPRMKFGNEKGLGKVSVPGRPVIWRRLRGDGPLGVIGQAGEPVADGCVCLNGNPEAHDPLQLLTDQMFSDAAARTPFMLSPGSQALVDQLTAEERN